MSATRTSRMDKKLIALCVPTYLRPVLLSDCIAQIAKATLPEGSALCLVVVDNDPRGNAARVFDQAKASCPFPAFYFHEPTRGTANARNRLLEEALKLQAQYVAFVDDDEFPSPDWLVHHLRALGASGAQISHGPVIQLAAGQIPGDKELKRLAKARPTGAKKHHVSGGNVMFDMKAEGLRGLRFDPFFNQVGGEDHDFFDRAKTLGAKSIWVREAVVYESLVPERQSRRYLFFRHYSGGINNVLKYAHCHALGLTWLHFLLKIIGKLFHLMRNIVLLNGLGALKDVATVSGYLVALPRCRTKA